MKRIVLVKSLIILLLMSFLFIGSNVYASTQTIPDGEGGVIKHYGSNNPVYINTQYDMKDREFRGCWVSPLVGDIGSFTNEDQYKKMMIEVLDNMEIYNLNVLVFHIRIMNDAFYQSKYNDWSEYYNVNPSWEALPWLIDECHDRGIEFHAWMNPYRVTNDVSLSLDEVAAKFPGANIARNSSYLLKGVNSIILNPGEPAVRNWLVKVCMEVVENYDVDAIHFDDYFYDNGINDTKTMTQYNTSGLSKGDWRRLQVDTFIKQLSTNIRDFNTKNNRRVQLGISPSGVYRAGNGVVTYDSDGNAITTGSKNASASFQHYDNYLYSDTLKWINEEWIDYILPQTYWAMNNPSCPYADLMEWWDKVVEYKNVKLYSGLGIYLNSSSGGYGWYTNKEEAYYEIMISNSMKNVDGVCFFKYSNIAAAIKDKSITKGVDTIWTNFPIQPEITTMDVLPIDDVKNLSIVKNSSGYKLSFDKMDDAKFYVIYRSENEITYSPNEVLKVMGDLSANGVVSFTDLNIDSTKKYYYAVKAQSYSNTLSDNGVKIDTSNIKDGELTDLGEIDDIFLSDDLQVDKEITVFIKPFYYSYGTKVEYNLEYSFDNETQKTSLTQFSSKRGYYCFDVRTPEGAKKLTITLTVTNNIGTATKTQEFKVVEGLPSIKNFGCLNNLYANNDVTFVWNNTYVKDAEYVIQYATDEINWIDLLSISSNTEEMNIQEEVTLPKDVGTIFYRVIITKDNMIGYSDSVKYTVNNYLGDYVDFTINGEEPLSVYTLEEGDKVVIRWKAYTALAGVTYMVLVSTDYTNWITASRYNSKCTIEKVGDYMVETIPLNYSKSKIYVQITAISNDYRSESDCYEFYIQLSFMFADELVKYMYDDCKANITQLNLFN